MVVGLTNSPIRLISQRFLREVKVELTGGMEVWFLNLNGFGGLEIGQRVQLNKVGGQRGRNGIDDTTASGTHDLGAAIHVPHAKGHCGQLEREASEQKQSQPKLVPGSFLYEFRHNSLFLYI